MQCKAFFTIRTSRMGSLNLSYPISLKPLLTIRASRMGSLKSKRFIVCVPGFKVMGSFLSVTA